MITKRHCTLSIAALGLLSVMNGQQDPSDSPILVVDSSVHAKAGKKFMKLDTDKHRARFHLSGNQPVSIDMWDKMGNQFPSQPLSGSNWHIDSGNDVHVYASANGTFDFTIDVVTPGASLAKNPGGNGVDEGTVHFAPAAVYIGSSAPVNNVYKACIHYCPALSCRPVPCPLPDAAPAGYPAKK